MSKSPSDQLALIASAPAALCRLTRFQTPQARSVLLVSAKNRINIRALRMERRLTFIDLDLLLKLGRYFAPFIKISKYMLKGLVKTRYIGYYIRKKRMAATRHRERLFNRPGILLLSPKKDFGL